MGLSCRPEKKTKGDIGRPLPPYKLSGLLWGYHADQGREQVALAFIKFFQSHVLIVRKDHIDKLAIAQVAAKAFPSALPHFPPR